MQFGERLEILRKAKGVTRKALLEAVGASHNQYQNWVSKGKIPLPAMMEKLASYFHVPVEYLTGREDRLVNVKVVDSFLEFLEDNGYAVDWNEDETVTIGKDGKYVRYNVHDFYKICDSISVQDSIELAMKMWVDKLFPRKLDPRDYFQVETAYQGTDLPVYGDVSAGPGAYAEQRIVGWEESDDYADEDEYFYLIVSGDSMYPEIKDGDYVLVHVQDWIEDGQIAVVVVDEEGLVKKIERGEDYITLISINPHYPPRKFVEYEMNRVHILGHVIEVKRKFK